MNLERLHILYDHLMYGKLGHKKFDFRQFNSDTENKCGTAGCAIGECPVIWPEDWCFNAGGTPVLNNSLWVRRSVFTWFDITESEYYHLFEPDSQDIEKYGGKNLVMTATREQVAANIKAFINKMEKS